MENRQYVIGDLVIVKEAFCGANEPGNYLGYVYDTYVDIKDSTKNGVMIFTEHGEDLCGFSYDEQQRFLIYMGKSPFVLRIVKKEILQSLLSKKELYSPIFETLTQFTEDDVVKDLVSKILNEANDSYIKSIKKLRLD